MPFFEGRLFSATEVPRGKPAPDIFLFAAERMGATPARSVVVEDSVNGVLAGCAAGHDGVRVRRPDAGREAHRSRRRADVRHMRELPALLA